MARVKIPVSFSYTTNPGGTSPTYVSTSSGSYVSQAADLTEPVANTTVTVTVRSSGAPTTVWQTETGGATFTSLSTDASGNVPGWVNEGSYAVAAAPVGAFGGATYYFDAVRGDGVSNIAAGAVTTTALSSALQTSVASIATNAAKEIADIATVTALTVPNYVKPAGALQMNQFDIPGTSSGSLWAGLLYSGTAVVTLQGGMTTAFDATTGTSLVAPVTGLYTGRLWCRADYVGPAGVIAESPWVEVLGSVNGVGFPTFGYDIITMANAQGSNTPPYHALKFDTLIPMNAGDRFNAFIDWAGLGPIEIAAASYGVYSLIYESPL